MRTDQTEQPAPPIPVGGRSPGFRGSAVSALIVAAMILIGCQSCRLPGVQQSTRPTGLVGDSRCGVPGQANRPPATYDHVVWIFEENHSLNANPQHTEEGIIGNPSAPYINELASRCTYSTSFVDTHPNMPSEPHYLAAVSGSNCKTGYGRTGTGCITDDKSPAHHLLTSDSIFGQLEEARKSWTSYQESSPANCFLSTYPSSGTPVYDPKHDPALYFSNLHASCRKDDVPFPGWTPGTRPSGRFVDDIATDRLPTFAIVTPNLQNDMHISTGGSAARGDAWLASYLPLILDSATYRRGRTAVFVLWDETYNGNTDRLPNLIIAPTATRGPVSEPMNNIAVLAATQQMLGLSPELPRLGCTAGSPVGDLGRCPPESTADVRRAANI